MVLNSLNHLSPVQFSKAHVLTLAQLAPRVLRIVKAGASSASLILRARESIYLAKAEERRRQRWPSTASRVAHGLSRLFRKPNVDRMTAGAHLERNTGRGTRVPLVDSTLKGRRQGADWALSCLIPLGRRRGGKRAAFDPLCATTVAGFVSVPRGRNGSAAASMCDADRRWELCVPRTATSRAPSACEETQLATSLHRPCSPDQGPRAEHTQEMRW